MSSICSTAERKRRMEDIEKEKERKRGIRKSSAKKRNGESKKWKISNENLSLF